ncbi:hypothetical protein ACFFX0_32330 [Citricoccus parietis]|uniref:Uncharacterized protein n=1 Tax=Citricoccus parietis TaxID=592307 RepID=A0ABV5G9K2_9MICC
MGTLLVILTYVNVRWGDGFHSCLLRPDLHRSPQTGPGRPGVLLPDERTDRCR